MDAVTNLFGLVTTGIVGPLTISKTGTTARTATFPDAAITVAGSASALTSGRVPYVTTGGLLTDSANLTWNGIVLAASSAGATQLALDTTAAGAANPGFLWKSGGTQYWQFYLEGGTGPKAIGLYDAIAADNPLRIASGAGGAINLARPVSCSSTLSATSLTATGLTPGRVPYVTTGGLLSDNGNFTIDTANGILSVANGSTGSSISALRGSGSMYLDFDHANAGTGSLYIRARAEGETVVTIPAAAGGTITTGRPVTLSLATGAGLTVSSTTDASSASVAATVLTGGLAVGKRIFAGDRIDAQKTVAGDFQALYLRNADTGTAARTMLTLVSDTGTFEASLRGAGHASGPAVTVYANSAVTGGVSWQVAANASQTWYTNNTLRMTLSGGGDLLNTGKITSSGATSGIGYSTGAGGTVTQATSRTTGVTLNTVTGAITLVSASGSATWQSFTVTNSSVAATDTVFLSQVSGTDLYILSVTNIAAGSFRISFATTGGTTTEQPVFRFTVIKSVSA